MELSKFHTVIDIPYFNWNTGYKRKNLFVGSCFTENIGNRMAQLKYDTDINPFGILYNPVSISNSLRILIQKKEFHAKDLIYHNSLWHSFYHHSRFSTYEIDQALQAINNRINQSSEFLKETDYLFITYGTSWVYRFKKNGLIVSNCHKIPQTQFERFRLSIKDIVEDYKNLISNIISINSKIKIVFTVSPIRHTNDGAIENQRSKAILHLAVEELIQHYGDTICGYFPAYELMMDELRDYRFYADDMIHISNQALAYIWQKFENALIDKESQIISLEIQKLNNALLHSPFNKFTHEHLAFLTKTMDFALNLQDRNPFINISFEINYLASEMAKIKEKL